jgi:multisubunit Na+/H+ antiporter MnhF subunit
MEEKRLRKGVATKTFVFIVVTLAIPFIALGLYYDNQIVIESGLIIFVLAMLSSLEVYFRKPSKTRA